MHHLMSLLSLFLRLVRPARGLHAAPRVLAREVRTEARRRRASRVRRYAAHPATVAGTPVPDPRPAPNLRSEPPTVFDPPEALVRGYYLAHEARQSRLPSYRPYADLLWGTAS